MSQGLFGKTASAHDSLINFNSDIKIYISNLNNINVGFIPGNIKHYFHGSKNNRKYVERNIILIKHQYDPYTHLSYNQDGIIVPSKNMSMEFILDIYQYFSQRNEDEYYDLVNKKNILEVFF
jgi:hypothetical protein